MTGNPKNTMETHTSKASIQIPLVYFRFFHQSLNVFMAHHPITYIGGYRSIKISAYAAG